MAGMRSARTVAAGVSRRLATACLVAAAMSMPITSGAFAACIDRDRDVLLILDASTSMLQLGLGGLNRFEAARDAIATDLDVFPPGAQIALRMLGSRSAALRGDCQDSQLVVPFGPAATNRTLILAALLAIGAQGITPMSYALHEAMADFPEGSNDRTVVLVSDGGETCGADVCAAAVDLARAGIMVNTVAIQPDNAGQRQLQCIAQATGGQYFPVPTTTVLADQLARAIGICSVAYNPPPRRSIAGG